MKNKLKVFAPFDGHLISELELNSEEEVENALGQAHRLANDPDRAIPAHERIRILEKTADLVEERMEKFTRQAAEEGGKPLIDSRVELNRAVQGIRESARSINQMVGHEIPMGLTPSSTNRMAFTRREPIGVVVAVCSARGWQRGSCRAKASAGGPRC